MKTVLDIAKECGAKPALKGPAINQCYFLDEAQLNSTIEAWNRQNSEPIYQVYGQFGWLHTSKEYFYTVTDESSRRIVYLAPPQTQTVKDTLEMAANICEGLAEQDYCVDVRQGANAIRALIDQPEMENI